MALNLNSRLLQHVGKTDLIEASLGELLLQLVFFHKNSRQEIALSALIGQVRVSNLRRVAFIFYWPIVRIT